MSWRTSSRGSAQVLAATGQLLSLPEELIRVQGASRASAGLVTGAGTSWAPAPLTWETETGAGECLVAAVPRTRAQGV